MTTILHKRGTGVPSADDLSVGEIALDTSTGTAYTKLSNGTVVEIGGAGGGYDDTQIRDDLAQEIQDREEGDQALQDQIDSLGSGGGSGGGGSSVGAMSEGSVVISPYNLASNNAITPRAIDYSEFNNPAVVRFAGTDGIQPPSSDAEHYRNLYGVVWSEYWQRYFTVSEPTRPYASVSAGPPQMHLMQSVDGVHWSDMGRVYDLVGWSTTNSTSGPDGFYLKSGKPILIVDEGIGRIWFAGRSGDSGTKYPLSLAYYDISTNTGGAAVAGGGMSGSKASFVVDWNWVPNFNANNNLKGCINFIFANRQGYFQVGSITSGANSPDLVNTYYQTETSRDEDKLTLLTTKSGGMWKHYIQGQGARFWHSERINPTIGNVTQGTSSSSDWSNRVVGMSPSYMIKLAPSSSRTTVQYIRTDNDDWKTNSATWSSGANITGNNPIQFIDYDPVMDDWLGGDSNGDLWRSEDGISWSKVARMGMKAPRYSFIARRTSRELQ
jgi:hypothetical protein